MPCYDARRDEPTYINGESPERGDRLQRDNIKLIGMHKSLEAALCALCTEIESEGLIDKILPNASRHGLIDLMGFWENHKTSDRGRLANEMHKYSKHEQAVILDVLKAQSDD